MSSAPAASRGGLDRIDPAVSRASRPRIRNPMWMEPIAVGVLGVMIAMEFGGAFGVLESKSPVSPFTAIWALAAAVAALRVVQDPTILERVAYVPVVAMVGYVFGLVFSVGFSDLPLGVGSEAVTQGVKDFLYFIVISVLAVDIRYRRNIALAIAGPPAIIGFLSSLNVFVLGPSATFGGFVTVTSDLGVGTQVDRIAGPLSDSNFWGRFLVMALVFGYVLIIDAQRGRQRVLAAAAVVGILLGIYTTGSRGTFLASAAVTVIFILLVQIPVRRLLIGAAVLGPVLFLVPGVGSRIGSILGLVTSAQEASVDASIQLRIAAQDVAVAMFQNRPFTGVGAGGFTEAFPNYVSSAGLQVERFIAPHNVYLERLAESGLIGLLTWLAFVLTGLAAALHASRLYAPAAAASASQSRAYEASLQSRAYAAALTAGIAGWLLSSIFLHLSYFRVLLIFIALAGSLQASAVRHRRVQRDDGPPSLPHVRRLVVPVVCAALALAMGNTVLSSWQATRIGYVQTRLDDVYADGVANSETLLTTLALIMRTVDETVDAQGDPRSGSIRVTAEGGDPDTARGKVENAARGGGVEADRAGMPEVFVIEWTPIDVRPAPPGVMTQGAAALGGFLAGWLVVWGWGRARSFQSLSHRSEKETGEYGGGQ